MVDRRPRGAVFVLGLAMAGLATSSGCGESSRSAAAQQVSPVQLVADGALLLDVRTPAEFSEGHVDGALNIAVQQLESRLDELDPARPVVVYCRSGTRSATAASLLRDRGFSVTDVGAMSDWPRPEQIVQ